MTKLIGISSRMGGGKDTTGRIIQYLTQEHQELSLEDMLNYPLCNPSPPTTPWEIKKYAGKLKECVSLITGISVMDLENEQVKNSVLGPEWNQWAQINETTKTIQAMTVRVLLQKLGTEGGRSVHPDLWVNALFSDYDIKPRVKPDDPNFITKPKKYKEEIINAVTPSWIITDCRFPNEVAAIEKRDGILIRINREQPRNHNQVNTHPSEIALDCHNFKYVIDNNGTIPELVEKVELILKDTKIL